MSTGDPWVDMILAPSSPADAWAGLLDRMKSLATSMSSPVELHNQTKSPDRLLAECAWPLWQAYPMVARRTSQALVEWWTGLPAGCGRAVLVLDAMSLRELTPLLGGAEAQGIKPVRVEVSGSEAPSDTEQFAKALGAPSRASLKNNAPPSGFALSAGGVHTDVLSMPFEDCMGSVPNQPSVFLWHTWLDDQMHVYHRLPDQIYRMAAAGLQGDGFWKFVDRLRQGRRLVITSDHGYAVSKLFSTEEKDERVIEALREAFGASRCRSAAQPWPHRFMPPIVMTANGHHLVMGQRKWKVQGGFPHVDHGGLTLLEVAVPFVEFPAI